ncbi:MAG: 30S ribosomal protein S20 [Bacteroidetes bacterium GWF2_38_335]|nr:MAG: 30S ribosomal protein S20 [Bacteroidetes bacterium GWF2_38_335]OFY81335.1 MAG: 30S ribosomal protein S20 [Bacteroidetes bacterium RIFOXYA12_FULL_38_20]HBS85457.1 30S ribosomal protein S20 [Bacteroidales bacterium]
MAHHLSALKRIRQTETKRVENKFYAKTTRNALKKFRSTSDKAEAEKMFPEVSALLDKLAKKGVIHKNKASNLKSSMAKQVAKM